MELDDIVRGHPVVEGSVNALLALIDAAFVDELTRLPNRAAYEAAVPNCDRTGGWATVLIDLSGFKALNDGKGGYEAGDTALRQVGKDVASIARAHKAAAFRLGGDEFVLLVKQDAATDLLHHAQRLLRRVDFEHNGESYHVSANIGWAPTDSAVSVRELVRRAGDACHEAKLRGGVIVQWDARLALDPTDNPRKKCPCGATTSLLVPRSKRHADALSRCANCGQAISA